MAGLLFIMAFRNWTHEEVQQMKASFVFKTVTLTNRSMFDFASYQGFCRVLDLLVG